MSRFNEPDPEHRNAIAEINERRQKALTAVGEYRKRNISLPHSNLAPPEDGESLPVIATQAVADYLMQLRPYRKASKKWEIDFGVVNLPTKMPGGKLPGRDRGKKRPLWLCRQPEVPLQSVSDLIPAFNMTVYYSTNKPGRTDGSYSPKKGRKTDFGRVTVEYQFRAPSYPGKHAVDEETWKAIQSGSITPDEAVEMDMTIDQEDGEDGGYEPASPYVSKGDHGRDGRIRAYKFVFGEERLLQAVSLADEVAAEMDLLIELDDPDYTDSGKGAV